MKHPANYSAYQILLFFIVFCACTLGPSLILADLQAEQEEHNININVANKPLSDVSNIISAQTGYKIILDQALSSVLVSGVFSDASTEQFFSSVLKGKNIVIKFDNIDNSLTVLSFGHDGNNVDVFSASNRNNNTTNLLDISLAELNALNKSQLVNSPKVTQDSIIFGTNMTLGELDNLQRKQQETDSRHQLKDDIIMGTNMTIGELDNLQLKQLESDTRHQPKDDIIMGTDMTIGELDNLQLKQLESDTRHQPKDESIPGSNMTIDDINAGQGR